MVVVLITYYSNSPPAPLFAREGRGFGVNEKEVHYERCQTPCTLPFSWQEKGLGDEFCGKNNDTISL